LGLILWGLPIGLAATTSYLVVVLGLFCVIGLGNDLVDIGWLTALPRMVPDHLLGGVLGAFEGLLQVGMALGAIVAGVLLSQFDVRVALVVIGSLLPVAALVAAPRLRRFDAGLQSRDVEVDLLRQQPLFEALSIPLLDNLAARLVPVQYAAGTVIMTEGEKGDHYVLIASGTVEIRRSNVAVAVLSSGDAFGEIALVRNTPRNATAVASVAVSARILGRDGFLAALGCDPRVRTAAERLADKRS
jgi:MFS family permease